MIDSIEKLNECLQLEKQMCIDNGYKGKIHSWITSCEIGKIVQYLEALRKDEYYTNIKSKNIFNRLKKIYYRRKHNKLGWKLGISIPVNTFGKGLMIYHSQGIIVHKDVRCGCFCKLHGLTCIGNKGMETEGRTTPILGDRIDIGVGAKIIGPIILADDIKIAAGAVVCKSCKNKGVILAGVPAKIKENN